MLFSGSRALKPRWAMACGREREGLRREGMAEAHFAAVCLLLFVSFRGVCDAVVVVVDDDDKDDDDGDGNG
jgi:hypothetical protein